MTRALPPRRRNGRHRAALAALMAVAMAAGLGVGTAQADGSTLEAAAVLGVRFSEDDLLAMVGDVGRWVREAVVAGVVEREGPVGKAHLYVRAPEGLGRRDLFDCFPPILAGFEPRHGFAF